MACSWPVVVLAMWGGLCALVVLWYVYIASTTPRG